jgi:HAE1 family hydrophobic/amphiphilic exporter-1
MIGWREGLVAGLSIPLSFTIGFIGLYLSGNTINFISLFALILGIGVLVDAGIVMVESINRNISLYKNLSKYEAAKKSVAAFASPITAGTLTTVAVFTGLFVVSGVTGQFISGIPFTLIFVLFASLLVALGFIPLIATVFLKGAKEVTREEDKSFGDRFNARLENWYRVRIGGLIASRRGKRVFLTTIILLFFASIALIPTGFVKVVFFAQGDAPQVFIEIKLPEGSIKETTDLATRQVEEVLYKNSYIIEAYAVTVGSGSAFLGGGSNEKLANITVNLVDERDITSTEFIEKLRSELPILPGVDIAVSEPNEGPPSGSAIGVKLFGNDLAELDTAANQVAQVLREMDTVTNVSTSNTNNNIEYVLTLDAAKTAATGLNPLVVSQTLRAAVFGTEATNLTTMSDDIPVVVRLNLSGNNTVDPSDTNRTTIDALKNISIQNQAGDSIALSSLVTTTLRDSSTAINHEDQSRVVTVSADTATGGNVFAINAELTEKIKALETFPANVRFSLGGESEDSNQAFGELFLALIIGLVLMLAVLVLEFNSFRYTFYVLSIVPFSLIGILFGLAITGSALSFPSIMGFIALTGIIVNNSILLIDRMNEMRREKPDASIDSVVIEAAASRLRPIILTSLTTIVGMIPLLYSDPIWVPLATAIIFGLAFSVVITLVLVPIIYDRWPGKLTK